MADPLFWLALSLFLVAVSLTAVLVAAVPALRELGRASRSAEKLFDTLNRELPPTLEAIRLTGQEITELTDEVSGGVEQAGRVMQQVDQSVHLARHQAQQLQMGTQSLAVGLRAAWRAWRRSTQSSQEPERRSKTGSQGGAPSSVGKPGSKSTRKYSPEGRNLRFAKGNASEPRPVPRPRPNLVSRPAVDKQQGSDAALPASHSAKNPDRRPPRAVLPVQPSSSEGAKEVPFQSRQLGLDKPQSEVSSSSEASGSARDNADLD